MLDGMPKLAQQLSALAVNKIRNDGWHAVGGVAGLLLQVRSSPTSPDAVTRSWVLRTKVNGRRKVIGLGSFPHVSLADARQKAQGTLVEIQKGVDPKAKKKAAKSARLIADAKAKTFKECAVAYMSAQKSKFTNAKHQKQWESTIQGYAYPLIGSMLVSDIAMRDVLGVLEQKIKDPQTKKFRTFWEAKTETASRVQGRIKKIMDYAIVNEYRTTINPATWVGYLETQLPAPNKIKNVEHQPAVPYSQVGDFMIALRKHSNISAKALEFLIMTSVRSGSVRKAVWSEINMDDGIWTIPAKNTKMKKEHRVPLPKQAIALLKSLDKNANNPRIFPSVTGKDLSDSAISKFMKEMRDRGEFKSDGVPHGFRSTFRDWAAEKTKYPDDIRKVASGHKAGNAVQEVYQRTDLLEKRRKLMADWLNFIDKPSPKVP